MKIRLLTLPALLALAFSFGSAQAQNAPGAGTSATGGQSAPVSQPGTGTRNTPAKKLDRKDRKFIDDAAEGGMTEVQMGQLAQSKATDPNVKSFAGMLVDQHTAANNELTKIANAKGVELPAAPKHSHRRDIEKMGKKSGSEFDRDYVRYEIKDHEKDIKKFEKAARDLKDPDVKAWAGKTLPTLREHLAAAQKLPQSGQNSAAMGASRK